MSLFDWMERGLCRDMDPNLFFPHNGNVATEVLRACNRCPSRSECYMHALRHEDYGIWAGTGERERRKLRKAAGIRFIRIEWSPSKAGERVKPEPCGTDFGYHRHRRAGEEACEDCKAAHVEANAIRKRKGRANVGT